MQNVGSISTLFAKFNPGVILAKCQPGYKEKLCRQKLDEVFQVRNSVREVSTGRLYQVFDTRVGVALLTDAHDNMRMVDWFSDDGRLRMEIASNWELVSAPTSN